MITLSGVQIIFLLNVLPFDVFNLAVFVKFNLEILNLFSDKPESKMIVILLVWANKKRV